MIRNPKLLAEREYDVLIVGAGIYGAAAAWEAASRGLSVALVDRGDFGGATSANSLKIVHGGLRYLQALDMGRMRESIRERSLFLKHAPHLVHPLACVMPTYGFLMKSRLVMRLGLLANDWISADRNRGLDPDRRIPSGRVMSRGECLKRVPGIDPARITGAAMWHDAQMESSERLLLAFVKSAVRAGAVAANYTEVNGFLRSKNRVIGALVRDMETGQSFEVRSGVVLNAAGGFADKVIALAIPGLNRKWFRLSTAMNLVLSKNLLPGAAAGVNSRFEFRSVGGRTRYGSRVLFLAPWNGFTLAGTRHRPFQGDPDGLAVTEEEVRDFLGEVCRALPGVQLRREDVSFFHKGFLPMDGTDAASGEVRLAKHYRIHDHAKENGVDGLVTVIGVKYTTARDVAEKTVDVLFRKLGRPAVPSVSRRMRLDGGDLQRFTGFRENVATSGAFGLTPEVLNHLAVLYGTAYPEVLKYIEKDPAFGRTVPGSTLVLAAEIVHAVREEAAVRLSDAVRRRTNLGSGRNPGAESLRFCAGLMAGELGWDPERIDAEIRDTEAAYRTAPGGKSWA